MTFEIDNRVTWTQANDGGQNAEITGYVRGTITDVNHALGKVHVQWDDGTFGWCYDEDLLALDVIERLGDLTGD